MHNLRREVSSGSVYPEEIERSSTVSQDVKQLAQVGKEIKEENRFWCSTKVVVFTTVISVLSAVAIAFPGYLLQTLTLLSPNTLQPLMDAYSRLSFSAGFGVLSRKLEFNVTNRFFINEMETEVLNALQAAATEDYPFNILLYGQSMISKSNTLSYVLAQRYQGNYLYYSFDQTCTVGLARSLFQTHFLFGANPATYVLYSVFFIINSLKFN
jgi:hypothetical protein